MRLAQRGSALLFTVVLLTVLTIAGVATVSLMSRERQNASAQSRYQKLIECGSAAQAVIWAQLAKHGPGYLGDANRPVGEIKLPDGTQLAAPLHYDQDPAKTFADVAIRIADGGGAQGNTDEDCTNRYCYQQLGAGNVRRIVATCRDRQQRQFEVELSIALAL